MPARDHRFSVESRCELLPYLLTLPLGLSRKAAKDLLRFRSVTVSRTTTVRHDTPLEPGDVVTIASGKQIPASSIERHGLKIVHLDDDIVVVDKREGLLSMGSEGEKERTAHRILNEHLKALTGSPSQQAFIVHRLDRETSGLMMFARSRAIQAVLQDNWKTVTKKYLAIVEGVPSKTDGTLRDNLVESKSLRMHRVERGGELAITHYRVLKEGRANSLVELTLETGVLTLSGERSEQVPRTRGEEPQYRRTERSQGHFYRRFVLPNTVDSDKVNATGKNGVLTVRIPKQAKAMPRRIKIAAKGAE